MKEFGKTINDLMSVSMKLGTESIQDPEYAKAVIDLMDAFNKMK